LKNVTLHITTIWYEFSFFKFLDFIDQLMYMPKKTHVFSVSVNITEHGT